MGVNGRGEGMGGEQGWEDPPQDLGGGSTQAKAYTDWASGGAGQWGSSKCRVTVWTDFGGGGKSLDPPPSLANDNWHSRKVC